MDAKTQDAAGVLVRGTLRVSFHPEADADRRWVATRADNSNIWDASLYLLANHLNLDVEEFNRCAALMEPAAPTGETVCSHGCVQDECEVCAEFDIKMGEAVMGCLALRENAEDWMPATLRKHADALNELLQQMRALHVRAIDAARASETRGRE